MDDFYAARTANTTALLWSNFAPPFSRDEAEKKAAVLTAGMQSSEPQITEGTVAPGTLADLECDPFAFDIGDGFASPIKGDLTSNTQDERAVFGRPEHAGKLK